MDIAGMTKFLRLQKILKDMGRVVIAYSGGCDSAFLLKAAIDTLGKKNVLAVIAKSAAYQAKEYHGAVKLAREMNAPLMAIYAKWMTNKRILKNPVNRCYYCKKELFGQIVDIADKKGFDYIADGSNIDDKKDTRYGSIAGREFGVRSPLTEACIGKKEIRVYSKKAGLSTWSKPPLACLASRFPYGDRITKTKLMMVEKAEEALWKYGFEQVRVRIYGKMARIEVHSNNIAKFSDMRLRRIITDKFRKLGFSYVTVDIEGYRTGSMNEVIGKVDKYKLK